MAKRDAGVEAMVDYLDEDAPARLGVTQDEWISLPQAEKFASLTAQERKAILEQARLCTNSFQYAARNYFWLINNEARDQLFSLWESQYLVLETMKKIKEQGKAQKIMIIKARRLGMSLLIEALIAWRTIFFRNINAIVVSTDEDSAKDLFGMMKHIYDKLPWWLQPEVASREEKSSLVFDRRDPTMRSLRPGNQSQVMVQYATQFSGVGEGRRISAAHLSEMAGMNQKRAQEIIQEDLTPAIHETPENFAFIETTGKGTGNYTHLLWRACEKLGIRAEWYPLFLGFFFETSRTISVPKEWKPQKYETGVRERIKREWVRCDDVGCGLYQVATIHGESKVGCTCPMCSRGNLLPVVLTNGQLAWVEDRRIKAEATSTEAVRKWKQEYAACVIGDTRVSTDKGILRIEDAKEASSTETGAVKQWVDSGVQPVVSVKTKYGRILVCTGDHRFFTPDGSEIAASRLASGQRIALSPPRFPVREHIARWQHSPTCEMSIQIDRTWGRFLGYFMGDGCWYGDCVSVAVDSKDPDVVEDIIELCQKITGRRPTVEKRGNSYSVRSNSVLWMDLLKPLGCLMHWENQSGYKRKVCVPGCIWKSPKHVVKEFLSALFECDGHAYRDTPKTKFFSCHEEFVRDIQLLLLGFGINSKISVNDKVKMNRGKYRRYIGRELILPVAASNEFHKHIGFISRRKRTSACIRDGKRRFAFKNRMEDYVESVAPAGRQHVFDLSIAQHHKFGANGLLVHNTAEDSFQVSGYSVFDDRCYEMVDLCIEEPIKIGFIGKDGKFHGYNHETKKCYLYPECTDDHRYLSPTDEKMQIWRDPVPGAEYSVGVDVSEGIGQDYSIVFVNRVGGMHSPDEQVAVWRCNETDPKELAVYANAIGRMYNEALMCVEYNTYMSTGDDMVYFHLYPNIYRWKSKDSSIHPQTTKLHWWTKAGHKTELYHNGRYWLRTGSWIIHSKNFRQEMTTFVKEEYEDRTAGHSREAHDDELMAGLIALYCPHDLEVDPNTGKMPMPRIGGSRDDGPKDYVMTCDSCHCEIASSGPTEYYTCPAGSDGVEYVTEPDVIFGEQEECGSIRLRWRRKVPLPSPQAEVDMKLLDGQGQQGQGDLSYNEL